MRCVQRLSKICEPSESIIDSNLFSGMQSESTGWRKRFSQESFYDKVKVFEAKSSDRIYFQWKRFPRWNNQAGIDEYEIKSNVN